MNGVQGGRRVSRESPWPKVLGRFQKPAIDNWLALQLLVNIAKLFDLKILKILFFWGADLQDPLTAPLVQDTVSGAEIHGRLFFADTCCRTRPDGLVNTWFLGIGVVFYKGLCRITVKIKHRRADFNACFAAQTFILINHYLCHGFSPLDLIDFQ